MTNAEKAVVEAAKAWAAAEQRLRHTSSMFGYTTTELIDPEEHHRINLRSDVTEQELLDAVAGLDRLNEVERVLEKISTSAFDRPITMRVSSDYILPKEGKPFSMGCAGCAEGCSHPEHKR